MRTRRRRLRHGRALLIGNSHYKDAGWAQLGDIPLQLKQLESGLSAHFDRVEVVQDVEAMPLFNKINDIVRTYGNDRNARLLIYYAGPTSRAAAACRRTNAKPLASTSSRQTKETTTPRPPLGR